MSRVITRLPEDVVNLIAAGEVIHRPVSAIKEMLENSIDAGATSISVRAANGGLKSLTIQDNGCGIREEDFHLVCERFATSKLKEFEQLREIGTYGFRGEALASISHVAKVTVTSKTAGQPCAFKANYLNGALAAPSPGQPTKPRPCAGVQGTTITVDDLFYNMNSRKRAMKNASDEYSRILDVVSRYAVQLGVSQGDEPQRSTGVGMVCKKSGAATPDLHTSASDTKLDNIRSIFGTHVATELILLQHTSTIFDLSDVTQKDNTTSDKASSTTLGETTSSLGQSSAETSDVGEAALVQPGSVWKCEGYISNANYNRKKSTYIFFINNRLVDCDSLKRSLDALYSEYLPKGTSPFVYLSIFMPARHIDVNVHPNKREVHFICEDSIVAQITQLVRTKLLNANSSRVFYTQQTLVSSASQKRTPQLAEEAAESSDGEFSVSGTPSIARKTKRSFSIATEDDKSQSVRGTPNVSSAKKMYRPEKLVRTDPKSAGLDTFFERKPQESSLVSSQSSAEESLLSDDALTRGGQGNPNAQQLPSLNGRVSVPENTFNEEVCDEVGDLSSVQELISAFEKRRSDKLASMLKDLVFVGWVDDNLSLVQIHTGLFLLDHTALLRELFYQQILLRFGKFQRIVLPESVCVQSLLEAAIKRRAKSQSQEEPENAALLATKYTEFLCQRSAMLDEYFRINIDPDTGKLSSLPEVIPDYCPQPVALVAFLLRISENVEWFDEKACFDTLACEIAAFYTTFRPFPKPTGEEAKKDDGWIYEKEDPRYIIKNTLLPQLGKLLVPSLDHADPSKGFVRKVTALEVLYKIFERC